MKVTVREEITLPRWEKASNTFSQSLDCPRKIQVELGDSKIPDSFLPQAKLMFWDNEVNFSLRAEVSVKARVEVEGAKLRYITDTFEVHQYEVPDKGEDGGLEFEWILPSKPAVPYLTATIRSKGLTFHKQLPFSTILEDGSSMQIEPGGVAYQPANVAYSYAVYHESKAGNFNGPRGKKYLTGKAFHIFRPKAVAADGSWVWCELEIDTKAEILLVTVPEDFLSSATYPIRVDPDFGYTSIGASTFNPTADSLIAYKIAAPADGTIDSITTRARCNAGSTNFNWRGALYSSASSPASLDTSGTEINVATITPAWVTSILSSPSITNGTTYNLSIYVDDTASVVPVLYRDAVNVGAMSITSGLTYPTFPNPAGTGTTTQSYSIYATYTASSAGREWELLATESGSDTMAMDVVVVNTWAMAATDSGPDVMSALFLHDGAPPAERFWDLEATESGSDTMTASFEVSNTFQLQATEVGSDTVSIYIVHGGVPMGPYTDQEIQAQCRALAGTAGMFNEDLHAAMTVKLVAEGQINERLMTYSGQSTASAAWVWLHENGVF